MLLLPAKTPPHIDEFTNRVTCGDALATLQRMPSESVHCIVTSPPYFGLRDYQVAGQIGLEETPRQYVEKLTALFREARRVLREDGTLWLNLGDSYVGALSQHKDGGSQGHNSVISQKTMSGIPDNGRVERNRALYESGLTIKNLLGIPWRVAFALQDDGWILRSDIIWSKPNPMPESVIDRPTKAHEYVFLMSKNARYWYDADAIREPAQNWGERDRTNGKYHNEGTGLRPHSGLKGKPRKATLNGTMLPDGARIRHGLGESTLDEEFDTRNKRSVWTIATQPNAEMHFATFPEKLIEPMILAGCPVGGIVLDPFFGSGTTGLVARRLGRKFAGIELNPSYVAIAERRLSVPYTLPMFETLALEAF